MHKEIDKDAILRAITKDDPELFGDQISDVMLILARPGFNFDQYVEQIIDICTDSPFWQDKEAILLPILRREVKEVISRAEASELVSQNVNQMFQAFFESQAKEVLKLHPNLDDSTIAMIILDELDILENIVVKAGRYSGMLESPYVDIVFNIRQQSYSDKSEKS